MIQEALEYLIGVGRSSQRDDKLTIANKEFLRNPDNWREITPYPIVTRAFRDEHNNAIQLGTIGALIDFVKAHGDRQCQILIAPSGCKAYFDIDKDVYSAAQLTTLLMVKVPFIPVMTSMSMTFLKFQDWLDQHSDRIKEYTDLAKAVKLFKAEEKNSVTVKENGPIITLSVAASKDCEGSGLPIPKEIEVTLPTGTREFLIPNIFLLRIIVAHGEVMFTLTKKEQDGSWDRLVEQAFDTLKGAGLTNALILEGADDAP